MKNEALPIFLALLLVSYSNCVGVRTSMRPSFEDVWLPLIAELNNEPTSTRNLTSVLLDLESLHQYELRLIKDEWLRTKYDIRDKSALRKKEHEFYSREIELLNGRQIAKLTQYSLSTFKKNHWTVARHVIETMESNPLISSKRVFDYQHGDQLGFCFARALVAHYLLLKSKVPKEDIVKVFALGDFMIGYQFWRFHVAVMVRDNDHEFIVIDPLLSGPMPYKTWMEITRRHEIKHPFSRARFYFTDPRKFFPYSGSYEIKLLAQEELKEYFYHLGLRMEDLLNQLTEREENKNAREIEGNS